MIKKKKIFLSFILNFQSMEISPWEFFWWILDFLGLVLFSCFLLCHLQWNASILFLGNKVYYEPGCRNLTMPLIWWARWQGSLLFEVMGVLVLGNIAEVEKWYKLLKLDIFLLIKVDWFCCASCGRFWEADV